MLAAATGPLLLILLNNIAARNDRAEKQTDRQANARDRTDTPVRAWTEHRDKRHEVTPT